MPTTVFPILPRFQAPNRRVQFTVVGFEPLKRIKLLYILQVRDVNDVTFNWKNSLFSGGRSSALELGRPDLIEIRILFL